MNSYTKYRLNIIIRLGLGGILLTIILRLIGGTPLFQFGTVVQGFLTGALVGLFELFFKSKFRKLNFITHFILKSVILTIFIYLLIICLLFVDYLVGDITSFRTYTEKIISPEMYLDTLLSFLLISILLFFFRLDQMLGTGNLVAYIKGTFHKPKEEQRIFMFLDLKDSTKIGEKLDINEYFSFLDDYYHFMTVPILETEARIYQYVGDEIVLTWDFLKGIKNNNCVEVFFKILQVIDQNNLYFKEKYGVIPEFKAGLHYGNVIRAQIGDIKKELVFNGDVLNTTARIQSICNEFGEKLLISMKLFNKLEFKPNQFSNLGFINLKGKENDLELLSIKQNRKLK